MTITQYFLWLLCIKSGLVWTSGLFLSNTTHLQTCIHTYNFSPPHRLAAYIFIIYKQYNKLQDSPSSLVDLPDILVIWNKSQHIIVIVLSGNVFFVVYKRSFFSSPAGSLELVCPIVQVTQWRPAANETPLTNYEEEKANPELFFPTILQPLKDFWYTLQKLLLWQEETHHMFHYFVIDVKMQWIDFSAKAKHVVKAHSSFIE